MKTMIDSRNKLIFDTSGLNALSDDKDCMAITKCLGIGFRVRLTETNLAEIGATQDPQRRAKLLSICQRLVGAGECIGPYHWIVEQQIKLHAARPDVFNWQRVEVRVPALEAEVARPELLTDNALAAAMCADFEKAGDEFDQLFRGAREAFPIPKDERIQITLADTIESLEVDGSPHWRMAADIYEQNAQQRSSETEVRAFIKLCPPFSMMMLASIMAQFHRSVRDFRLPALYRAGLLDLLSAVYLPYCDRFVTHDDGQYNALKALTAQAGLCTEVTTYHAFRESWLIAA